MHIAGTNGKGSVTAYLKAMLEAAGARVHVYTSPHLVRFHERIELAGPSGKAAPIGEETLVDVLTRTQATNGSDDITQFEITTAAAFLAFAEHPADVLLLEVGLGGRLDATNVVARPALDVITPISLDHAEKLGATLPKIASEKAGILRRGVPAVVSQQEPEAEDVIRAEALRRRCAADRLGRALRRLRAARPPRRAAGGPAARSAAAGAHRPPPDRQCGHRGRRGAAAGADLPHLGLGERAIEQGLTSARWPARMQRLDSGPLPSLLKPGSELWLDGGHNPAAGRALAQTLADLEERSPKPLHLIVGMMGLKDAGGFLSAFRGLVRHVVTVPIPGAHEAPHAPETLAETARRLASRPRALPTSPPR